MNQHITCNNSYNGVIYKSCLSILHLKGLNGYLHDCVTWRSNLTKYPSVNDLNKLICKYAERSVALFQIAPKYTYAEQIYYYENCLATLYAALNRQCSMTPRPETRIVNQLLTFYKNTIYPELKSLFANFHYSYAVWYNHLTAHQQIEMDEVASLSNAELFKRIVKIFCKAEKQPSDGIPPKNRCVSAINAISKYVMGPVVYAMEQYLKKQKGYCGGKNWDDLSKTYDEWKKAEYNIIQTDVSGWDRSIRPCLKQIFYDVFSIVAPHVTHVPLAIYEYHAYAKLTTLVAEHYPNGKITRIATVTILAQVFSGTSDTTMSNTLLNTILCRFVNECYLNLTNTQYDLLSKGDDNINAIPAYVTTEQIRVAYQTVFVPNHITTYEPNLLYINHGLGITLKFLTVGDTEDIDFCSTSTFYCTNCQTHRITRKLDRFIGLIPWSNSVVALNHKGREAYMQNLFESNLQWMRNLPIFRALNAHLQTNCTYNYTINGLKKRTLILSPEDELWYQQHFCKKKDNELETLISKFSRDEAYSIHVRQQTLNKCCTEAYYTYLDSHYGLERSVVDLIESQIANAKEEYASIELQTAFEYNNLYTQLRTIN